MISQILWFLMLHDNGSVASHATKREQQKLLKYSEEFDIFGNPSNCVPLVFEHFGHWGWRAHQMLQDLSCCLFSSTSPTIDVQVPASTTIFE